MNRTRGTALAFALALCLLAACGDRLRPLALTSPTALPPAVDEPLSRALEQALSKQSWDELEIEVECGGEAGMRSVTVFGSGVAIWDQERQLTLERGEIRLLLEAFRQQGFASLAERYGGRDDPAPGEPSLALELVCRVKLRLDGVEKQVFQLAGGRQSAALRELAEEVLAAVAGAGAEGERAASLAEGLAKVADGRLAGETVVLQLLEEAERPEQGEGGWLLRLEAGRATAQASPADGAEARVLALSATDISELARRLAEEEVADLPGNLYAPRYVDLALEVLGRGRSLQARQFAGLTRDTHGEAQRRFERVVEMLHQLYLRVEADGRPEGCRRGPVPYFVYRSITSSIARRHTAQKPTSSRVNMVQSSCGR